MAQAGNEVPGERSIKDMLPEKITYTTRIIKGEDSQGYKTVNKYSIQQELGEGSFGSVKLAYDNEA